MVTDMTMTAKATDRDAAARRLRLARRHADEAFSAYIRARDSREVGGKRMFVCISCGRLLPFSQADCGHYVNRAVEALRYSEENCHAQCRHCNRFREGNMSGFRRGLVSMYGEQRVTLLEASKNVKVKHGVAELELIARYYKDKTKKIKDYGRRI